MGRSAIGDGTSRLGADGLLLTTAFLWGVTFVAQKYAAATMPALAFVAARFAVSAAMLAPFRGGNGRLIGRIAARGSPVVGGKRTN